ncbi:MAG: hypothetical protein VB858_01135 [Planctomycetaceae bacterium]
MSPRNHADCDAILRGHFRHLLAQFGLTPNSKRGLAASDPTDAVDPQDEVWGTSDADLASDFSVVGIYCRLSFTVV